MFHISKWDLGEIAVLKPQVPVTYAKDECKITPRVCFAPTVEQCAMGIAAFGENPGVTILAAFFQMGTSFVCPAVYYTDENLFQPDPVSDFLITQEHWSLDPIKVERIGYIDYWAMVKEKLVVVTEKPIYIKDHAKELARYISDEDRQTILSVLDQ